VPRGGRSNAASTQLYDPRRGEWSEAMVAALGLPRRLLPPVVNPGTVLGKVSPEVRRATGWQHGPVIAPCSHDTPSAVAAVPGKGTDWAFLSSGTWSILGALTDGVVTTPQALAAGLCNGVTVGGPYLYRAQNGMWLLQQARAAWAAAGSACGYEELVQLAERSPPGGPLIDVDEPGFLAPPDMLAAVGAFCRRTGQEPPEEPGAVTRCLLESLALAYRWVLEQLGQILGRRFAALHVVGGGSGNALLCQWTANTTGLPVIAGPAEATVCGSLLTQAYARGALASAAEIREVARRSFPLAEYLPQETGYWEDRYGAYLALKEDG
jgi:rhamnulokinase